LQHLKSSVSTVQGRLAFIVTFRETPAQF